MKSICSTLQKPRFHTTEKMLCRQRATSFLSYRWFFADSLSFNRCKLLLLAASWLIFFNPCLEGQGTADSYAAFTNNGAWCWFSDPRAIYRDRKIFAGWITADGSVQIGEMNVTNHAMQTTTLAEKFEVDDHDNPALLFLPDGRLAVFYSKHAAGDMHMRVTIQPEDISAWTADRTLAFEGKGKKGVTYANPVMLSGEENAIYVFWRGSDFKPSFAVSKDLGKTWSSPRTLIRRASSGDANRPYVKVWSDGKDRIDFVFTDGHPRDEAANSVYFLRYEKGSFYKADGTYIGSINDLPLSPEKCDRVYDGATAGRAWIWDIVEDSGKPVIAYTRMPEETDHRYHYARWDGSRWLDCEVTPAGKWFPETPSETREREPHYSGGMVIDPVNPGAVFLSRAVKDVFEIERWSTPDGGSSWKAEAVTSNSKRGNVRPYVVRSTPPGIPYLMWMNLSGRYIHYTNFQTSIKVNYPSAPAPKLPPLSGVIEPEAVLTAMRRVADWQLAHPSRKPPVDWVPAAGYTGMMALADLSADPKYRGAMMKMAEDNKWKLGADVFSADDQCVVQTYAELYLSHREPRMIAPMQAAFDEILTVPLSDDLDFKSKDAHSKWSWCDSLFMAPPAWVRLWAATGESRCLDFAVKHWWQTSDFLYDKEEHLFFRDSTYFEKREANGRKVFWSRGNGWVMAGLARVLEYLPKDYASRSRFEQQFREMAERLLGLQQSDGMWRSSLLDSQSYPLKETSGTGFYCFAFAWGVNNGLLERTKYEPAAVKAWQALVSCVAEDGRLTHVQPVGADPKHFDEYSTDAFGVGAFLLAGSEMHRLSANLTSRFPAENHKQP